jgi:hypothetical protein
MDPDGDFSLASARKAAEDDQLADWVTAFLASAGSSNEALAGALAFGEVSYLGPVEFELDQLTPMAGPAEDEVAIPVAEDDWEEEIGSMGESLEQGWEPPPLLVSSRSDGIYIEDGNHRHEALRRHGATHVWAIVVLASDDEGRCRR